LRCAPLDVREEIAMRRIHPTQITTGMIQGFVPDLDAIDQNWPSHLPALAVAMARAATVQGGAVWRVTERAPEAVFVFQDILGRVRAVTEGRREAAYATATAAAWRFLDALIGRIADAAGPEATFVLVSPGWRGRTGVVLAAGPAARPHPDFLGADILDVAPTVLGLFGLEDRALAGQPISALPAGAPCIAAPSPPPPEPVEHGTGRDAAAPRRRRGR
jgi:hypothetical protein